MKVMLISDFPESNVCAKLKACLKQFGEVESVTSTNVKDKQLLNSPVDIVVTAGTGREEGLIKLSDIAARKGNTVSFFVWIDMQPKLKNAYSQYYSRTIEDDLPLSILRHTKKPH